MQAQPYKKLSLLGTLLLIASLLFTFSLLDTLSVSHAQQAYEVSFTETSQTVWEDAGTVTITLRGNQIKQTDTTITVTTVPRTACGDQQRWTDSDNDRDYDILSVDSQNNPVRCPGETQHTPGLLDSHGNPTSETVFDYTALVNHQVTIPGGSQSVDIPISIFDDIIFEAGDSSAGQGEEFILKVTAVGGTTLCDGTTACDSPETTIIILDQEGVLTFDDASSFLLREDSGSTDLAMSVDRALPFSRTYSLIPVPLPPTKSSDFTIPASITVPANTEDVILTVTIHDNDDPGTNRIFRILVDHGDTLPEGENVPFTDIIIAEDDLFPECTTIPVEVTEGDLYNGGVCALPASWTELATIQHQGVRGQFYGLKEDGTAATSPLPDGSTFAWGIGAQAGQAVLAWGGTPTDDNIVHGDHTISATIPYLDGVDEHGNEVISETVRDIFTVKDDDVSTVHVEWEPQRTWEAEPGNDLVIRVPVVYPGRDVRTGLLGYQTLTIAASTDLGGMLDVEFSQSGLDPVYTPASGGNNAKLTLVNRFSLGGKRVALDVFQMKKLWDHSLQNRLNATQRAPFAPFTLTASGKLEGFFYDNDACGDLAAVLPGKPTLRICNDRAAPIPDDAGGTLKIARAAGFEPGVLTVKTGKSVVGSSQSVLVRIGNAQTEDGIPSFVGADDPSTGAYLRYFSLDEGYATHRFEVRHRNSDDSISNSDPYTCDHGFSVITLAYSDRYNIDLGLTTVLDPFYEHVYLLPKNEASESVSRNGWRTKSIRVNVCP